MNFSTRGRMIEEQVEVMRLLWSQDVISYKGRFHTITEAGLNPLPRGRSIPLWMGGSADVLLHRVARLGDGWFPQGPPDDRMRESVERLHRYVREAGRDPGTVGIEARMNAREGDLDEWVRQSEGWRDLGATHISINTMGAGFKSPRDHIDAISRYKEAITG